MEEETLLAQWQESEHPAPALSAKNATLVLAGAVAATICFVALGWFLGDFNFYLLALVAALAAITLIVQQTRSTPRLEIVITNLRLAVGKKQHLMEDLAGFWLQKDRGTVVVNIEPKKPSLVPITFLFSGQNLEEARKTLAAAMPELESREPGATDKISRYFRF